MLLSAAKSLAECAGVRKRAADVRNQGHLDVLGWGSGLRGPRALREDGVKGARGADCMEIAS